MNYREKRKAAKRRQTFQGIALIVAMIVLAIGLFPLFNWMDCNRTIAFADAYEDCVANIDCTPSANQRWAYQRVDMEIEYCRRKY